MKKIIALFLVLTLALSSVSVFAAFPDLEEERWDWAREEINEMTDNGIIAGYPDGNFGPADGVTKLQSLLLMARIMGFYKAEMENTVSKAKELYGPVIEPYGVSNPDEVAFLMYYGIISEDELSDYLGNASEILKRYEAAIILTKTAGAEAEVLSGSVAALKYTDTPDIPSNARRYVNYVTEQGYMVGMTEDTFEPNTSVTRAQMAVMLYRIMKKLDITYISGNFISADGSAFTLVQDGLENRYTISSAGLVIRVDGKEASKDDIPLNGYVAVKFFGDTPKFIDAFTPVVDETVTGVVTSMNTGAAKKVTLTPLGGSESVSVTLSDSVVVTLGGTKTSFTEVKRGDTVTISIEGGVGKTLNIALRSEVISGASLVKVSYEPYASVTFVTSSGVEMTKALSTEVSVSRNNKLAELRELIEGDKVILSLQNDLVKQIKATSLTSEISGTIETVHLSAQPYIIVKSQGESTEYNIANDVEILLDEQPGTVYDLRVGAYVTLKIESSAVKSISSASVASTANTIMGTIDSINQSYYFFYITSTNAVTGTTERVQVFVKKNGSTKYIDSADGSSISLGKLKEGSTVLVTGNRQLDGSYIATAVVVMTTGAETQN